MILVSRAYDLVNNYSEKTHVMSVLATDDGFSYIFGTAEYEQMFDSSERVALVMSHVTQATDTLTCADYIAIAKLGLNYLFFNESFEVSNPAQAIRAEQLDIDKDTDTYRKGLIQTQLAVQALNTSSVFEDFPDLEDQLSSTDSSRGVTSNGMTNLVMVALGSIDPDGPNSWLLDDNDSADAESSSPSGIIVYNEHAYDADGMPITTGDK